MLYGCVFCGLLYLLSGELCMALYGSADAGRYLRWFSLLAPMLYCDAITDAMVKGLGQQKTSVRYNIFTSILDVVFLYLLLPRYGMGGYFASFLVTHLINFILSLRLLLKITEQRLPAHVPMLCAAAAGAGVLLSSTLSGAIVQAVAFLAIFISLLTLFRVLSKEDIFWIKGLVNKK